MKTTYNGVAVPANGKGIEFVDGVFRVPDHPVIPFIEGDGTGRDIWKASRRVFDAAVEKAYGGKRKIEWLEVFAGEKAYRQFQEWLPQDTVDAIRDFRVAIKGPLTTPVGGGIRSLNVTLRQVLDLYACVRPVRYFTGVPSPVRDPERMNVVIFRENTEDVYAGIEWRSGTPEVKKADRFPEQRNAQGRLEENPRGFRRGHQADVAHGHQAAGAPRHRARAGKQAHARLPWCTRATFRSSPKAPSAIGATNWPRRNFARRWSPSAKAGSSTTKTKTRT